MQSANTIDLRTRLKRETAWFLAFLCASLLLLPVAIYVVGITIFEGYGGAGLGGFFSSISSEFRNGQPAVIFLMLSPYLVWSLCRLTIWAYKKNKH
jgi:hypothetical protein